MKDRGYATSVGDEGGFAPNLKSNEEAIETIFEAIDKAGYTAGENIMIALDPAASEFFKDGKYIFKKSDKRELIVRKKWRITGLTGRKNIRSFPSKTEWREIDWDGWKYLTEKIGKKVQLVGDDLFVTNTKFLQKGIDENAANSILDKSQSDRHFDRNSGRYRTRQNK